MKKRIISVVAVVLVVAMLSVVLVACGAPKDIADAKAKLADAGYVGVPIGNHITALKTGGDKLDYVTAYMYENADDAKNAEAALKADYDNLKSLIDSKIKSAKDDDTKAVYQALYDSIVFKRAGNWIAFGNKDGVKAIF